MIPAIHPFAGAFVPLVASLLQIASGAAVVGVIAVTMLVARASRRRPRAAAVLEVVRRRLPRAA